MTHQIITFEVARQTYGVQMKQIKEVVVAPKVTPIPLSPNYIEGVANVRGEILAIINLEKKLELNSNASLEESFLLVVASEDINVGLLSSNIPETLSVPEKDINWQPNIVMQREEEAYIEAIIKQAQNIVILIDIFKLFSEEAVRRIV